MKIHITELRLKITNNKKLQITYGHKVVVRDTTSALCPRELRLLLAMYGVTQVA